jgi:hypothetical protein
MDGQGLVWSVLGGTSEIARLEQAWAVVEGSIGWFRAMRPI